MHANYNAVSFHKIYLDTLSVTNEIEQRGLFRLKFWLSSNWVISHVLFIEHHTILWSTTNQTGLCCTVFLEFLKFLAMFLFACSYENTSIPTTNFFFLHDRLWISPWIKSISNELDVIIHVIASQLSPYCDVINNRLWRHHRNVTPASDAWGRCVKIVVFIVIFIVVMSCKK